jgi:hypothetical protein
MQPHAFLASSGGLWLPGWGPYRNGSVSMAVFRLSCCWTSNRIALAPVSVSCSLSLSLSLSN